MLPITSVLHEDHFPDANVQIVINVVICLLDILINACYSLTSKGWPPELLFESYGIANQPPV